MKVLVIGRRLNVPVVAKSRGEAASPFRFLGALRPARQPDVQQVDSRTIGSSPTQSFLILDIDRWSYDETPRAA
jgi:hypothetical protein